MAIVREMDGPRLEWRSSHETEKDGVSSPKSDVSADSMIALYMSQQCWTVSTFGT